MGLWLTPRNKLRSIQSRLTGNDLFDGAILRQPVQELENIFHHGLRCSRAVMG